MQSRQVRVDTMHDLVRALDEVGVPRHRPVLAVVGGASGLSGGDLKTVRDLLHDCVVPALDRWQAAAVDGGTYAGIMRLLGEVREAVAASFPLVGVAAEGTVLAQGEDGGGLSQDVTLDPRHSHVLLVPGTTWGEESPWLSAVATAIADGCPSATLVLNGGEITYKDMELSLAAARPLIVVAGTGRTADRVAAAKEGDHSDQRAAAIARSPLTRVVRLDDSSAVSKALRATLGRSGPR